jgi:hypothetical protein
MSKDQKLNITPRVYSEQTKREDKKLYVAGPRRVEAKPMEGDNREQQGLINRPQAVRRSPTRELQEEMTTPTTAAPTSGPRVRPRQFVSPVEVGEMFLFGKQIDVDGGTVIHFRTPDVTPPEQ